MRGTVGIEAACFGIPVITAGSGRYDNLGFTKDHKNKKDYLNTILNLHKVKVNKEKTKQLALKFAYYLYIIRTFTTDHLHFYFDKNENSKMWAAFDENALQSSINDNNIVFVDITADWCVTCQTNKIFVLNSKKVVNFLNEESVMLFRGDWTNKNPKILAYLNKYKRSGIPFNIVYGPSNPNGYILPEILTKETMIEAIKLVK